MKDRFEVKLWWAAAQSVLGPRQINTV
jgi:hypothetical protein